MLSGSWLLESRYFDAAQGPKKLGRASPRWRRLPCAFPTTERTLTRWPRSSEVLSVEPAGAYLHPEHVDSMVELASLAPVSSLLIDGTLESLDEALERVAAKRRAKRGRRWRRKA